MNENRYEVYISSTNVGKQEAIKRARELLNQNPEGDSDLPDDSLPEDCEDDED